ncbi:helix-turn-helix domain-containing protein [Nocardioides sp. DS6]|uniref:Helix-turn-helix domain-containing protein n=1 Tax=Nocardioides eburneus TaxID=3231482 RepID=A0ABV3T048_9ACTN
MDTTAPSSIPHPSPVAGDDHATDCADGTDRADLASQLAVLTISQLAAYLGVSLKCFYDLRSAGRGLRDFRVGRELRLRRTEVVAWLAGREQADAVRHGAKPATVEDPDRLAGRAP